MVVEAEGSIIKEFSGFSFKSSNQIDYKKSDFVLHRRVFMLLPLWMGGNPVYKRNIECKLPFIGPYIIRLPLHLVVQWARIDLINDRIRSHLNLNFIT